MNNKEFIAELSRRLGYTVKDTSSLMVTLVAEMTEELEDENVIAIQNIGSFEVRKKQERVVVNPATQQRMLVPPKLVINFKPSTSFKERMQ
ncbi:HU family DNA-binding protein [Paraprevotella xylaniphila]|jgi:DNA-binding protein HU-beta|uniref:HU family DNA-binding protein n=1 Tax=Paraprevotella xylaniphila TaxID=454155 RepID=UPI001032885D|nr:HU family DNA-binding protein [Paraprevotella xylaniphila]